jgi:hypothetical protein
MWEEFKKRLISTIFAAVQYNCFKAKTLSINTFNPLNDKNIYQQAVKHIQMRYQ